MGRHIWNIAGLVSVALGIIGAFLPIMPTTVFLIIAAFCFARGSDRLHGWLVNHPRFGPPIRDWESHGAIRPAAKRLAVAAIVLSVVFTFAIGLPLWVLGLQAAVLAVVSAFILTRPDGPRE